VRTDRTDVVPVAPAELWDRLAEVPAYPSFWPWLQAFDGRRLAAGEEWHGTIVVAGPSRLAVTIHLDEVVPGRGVQARVAGDLSGRARIDLAPASTGTGTDLHLVATLVPEARALRLLTRWARPLAQASHDRVIGRALRQLSAHLAG